VLRWFILIGNTQAPVRTHRCVAPLLVTGTRLGVRLQKKNTIRRKHKRWDLLLLGWMSFAPCSSRVRIGGLWVPGVTDMLLTSSLTRISRRPENNALRAAKACDDQLGSPGHPTRPLLLSCSSWVEDNDLVLLVWSAGGGEGVHRGSPCMWPTAARMVNIKEHANLFFLYLLRSSSGE
jgi:hypothetical protein